MNIMFNLTVEHNVAHLCKPQILYSSTWIEVSKREYIKHRDGSETPEGLVVSSSWFYVVFTDMKQLRKAYECLGMFLR
jgi:hypothetical protein